MSNIIKVLDDETIRQIAAGEVINSPYAIVKELLENSIDANSMNIIIEIKNGGKTYIRVTDDGDGINKDDIELAFKRHSTSKLKSAKDLYNLYSLGFRGEALSSISAVSNIELVTKTKKDEYGSINIVENSSIISKEKTICSDGTTFIIRNLFYNMPVRKDFLKSDLIESNKITEIITKIALGNPDISFKYIKDNKVLFKTPGDNKLLNTIYSVLGKSFSDNLNYVYHKEEDIVIHGYISSKDFYRSNRMHQYLYINNRTIINTGIRDSIESMYKSLIPINKFPIYILFITINPNLIDVNIHPSKEEVRFINQNLIENILVNTIASNLNENLEITSVNIENNYETHSNIDLPNIDLLEMNLLKNTSNSSIEESSIQNKVSKVSNVSFDYIWDKEIEEKIVDKLSEVDDFTLDDHKYKGSNFLAEHIEEYNKDKIKFNNKTNSLNIEFKEFVDSLNVLGVIFDTYIIAENKVSKDLVLVDQHAAHERIMYEKLLFEFNNEGISTQVLLSPEIINLTSLEKDIYKENKDLLSNLGFKTDEFGDNSIIIREVPIIFGEPEIRKLFFEIFDNLGKEIKTPYDLRVSKIMKLSCTKAIKAGDKIKDIEIKELFNLLSKTNTPYTCPHGRPTILKLSKKDIEKLFKRIM